MTAENVRKDGCPQRDSAEHEGHAQTRRPFDRVWKERGSAQSMILEKILEKDNLKSAFKRVKKDHGAPGVDGMTIEDALPFLREHQKEFTERIKRGKYQLRFLYLSKKGTVSRAEIFGRPGSRR